MIDKYRWERLRSVIPVLAILVSLCSLSAAAPGGHQGAPAGKATLTFAVVLMRHGVRSPIRHVEDMSAYAGKPCPTWGVPPGAHSPGAQVDRAILVVLNADYGKVIQSFPISNGADADVYDPKTGLIFVSTRDGWIHIFDEDSPDRYSDTGKVKTEFGAKTMAYDSKTRRIFVDTVEFGKTPTKQHPHSRTEPIPGTFHCQHAGGD